MSGWSCLTSFFYAIFSQYHNIMDLLCSLEKKKPKFFKTHPTFVFRPLLLPFMASINPIYFLVFHYVLIYMGNLHLVFLALNLSSLDAGILIRVQKVRLLLLMIMFSLNMVDCSMSILSLSTWILLCLKVIDGVGGVVAPMILVSAPVPLGLIWV